MLSRLVLLALQLIVAWLAAPEIIRYIPRFGDLQLFIYAAVFAVLVWIVGLVMSQVLRETGMPSGSTLASALIVALIGAAIILWLPTLIPDVGRLLPRIDERIYPLIGAVIGYHARR
jgi:uncharacterized membrane protein YeaQ/YmgE (transglycosylase-associated protein family)